MNYLFHILLTINCVLIASGQLLFRGRPNNKYGMFGLPVQHNLDQYYSVREIPREQWLEQKLNHFDPADNRTWKQRYFINDTFHTKGGPVFLHMGAEGPISTYWVTGGQMATNYAKRFNAMSVSLEHRYYGESHPTPDISTENLQYLSSEQALQDTAHFIEYLTDKLSLNSSKWYVFGGSYAGALSVWLRLKYPHLVSGAVASSAGIEAIVNFKDYYSIIDQSLGQSCTDAIREATVQLGKYFKDRNGWNAITAQLPLCYHFNGSNLNDVHHLADTMAVNIALVVQFNRVTGNITIDDVCKAMTNKTIGALARYAQVQKMILKSKKLSCLDSRYVDLIKYMSHTEWNAKVAQSGVRQWTYQTCTEFAFFQTSDLKDQPFGPYFPVDYFIKKCVDIFGAKFNLDFVQKAVELTNKNYGGSNVNVTRVIFINGSLDPWHVLSVLKNLNEDSESIMINGTAHCADMLSDSHRDPEALIEARGYVVKALEKFLNKK